MVAGSMSDRSNGVKLIETVKSLENDVMSLPNGSLIMAENEGPRAMSEADPAKIGEGSRVRIISCVTSPCGSLSLYRLMPYSPPFEVSVTASLFNGFFQRYWLFMPVFCMSFWVKAYISQGSGSCDCQPNGSVTPSGTLSVKSPSLSLS